MGPYLPGAANSAATCSAREPVVVLNPVEALKGTAAARIDRARDRVTVTRRIGGVLVLEAVSLRRYCGVAVRLRPGTDGLVEIALVGEDAPQVTVVSGIELDEAVARWRGLGRDLCLPLIFIDELGHSHAVTRPLGKTIVREALDRRSRKRVSRWKAARRRMTSAPVKSSRGR